MTPIIVKKFESGKYFDIIHNFNPKMIGSEFERACLPIAYDILTNYEGFQRLENPPTIRGRPFDVFGYKQGCPYIIELKASLTRFHAPGEVQKQRLQDILRQIAGLSVALLQINLKTSEYRMLDDAQVRDLFETRHVSLDPIIAWLNARMRPG